MMIYNQYLQIGAPNPNYSHNIIRSLHFLTSARHHQQKIPVPQTKAMTRCYDMVMAQDITP